MTRTFSPSRELGRRFLPALLALLALGLGLTLGSARGADGEGVTPERYAATSAYLPDRQTAAYRSALDGSDVVTDLDALPGTITPYSIMGAARRGGRQNLAISCRFSDAAATATLWVAYYYYDGSTYTLLGVDQPFAAGSVTSIAATSARNESSAGDYVSHTYTFDTYGATHAIVACTAVSAGTVDLWVGSY